MLEITYDFEALGEAEADAFLDAYELNLMFEQTARDLGESLERKLEGVVCAEHGHAPRMILRGRYDLAREEMDISYHLDCCCPLFMARVVKILNNVN